jgi:uncharacterized membrane protein
MLWANLNLLFWLSLFPITTAWVGENPTASAPTAAYGVILLLAALSYMRLQQAIIATQGSRSLVRQAVGGDWKGKLSPVAYAVGIVAAWWSPGLAQVLYLAVALLWLVPDRRIESVVSQRS